MGAMPNHHGRFADAAKDATKATFELYDLQADPAEQRDVASEHRQTHDRLRAELARWLGAAAGRE